VGFAVFPVGGPTGKAPLTRHGLNDATTDPRVIDRWPLGTTGYAVALPDDVVVVDIDPRNGGDAWFREHQAELPLKTTLFVQTGGGGYHVWLANPNRLKFPAKFTKNGKPIGVDFKQHGGYVIMPGSLHASGKHYAWALPGFRLDGDSRIDDCPEWLLERGRLYMADRASAERVGIDDIDEPRCAPEEHDRIAALIEPHYVDGQKHDIAKQLGGWLKQRGMSKGDVAAIMDLLPSNDPDGRLRGALAAFGIASPFGYEELAGLVGSETMGRLETVTPDLYGEAIDRASELIDAAIVKWCNLHGVSPKAANDNDPRQRARTTATQIKHLQADLERAKVDLARASTALRDESSLDAFEAHEAAKTKADQLKIALAQARADKAQAAAEAMARETRLDPATLGQVKITDAGMADAIATQYAGRLLFCEARRSWFSWDGCQWSKEDGQAVATQTVFELSRQLQQQARDEDDHDHDKRKRTFAQALAYEGAQKAAGALAALKTIRSMRVGVKQLDAAPHLLNCANGVVDLTTGELSSHDPALHMTKCTGVAFTPGARSELWENYLDDLTGGDDVLRAYMQRAAGSSLWGYPTDKVFFFLWGVPDSGKSRFLDALRAALGEYAGVADFSTWLQHTNTGGNRGDLVDLAGTRIVVSSEVRRSAKLNSELVKAVTGGDTLKAAAKYESEVSFQPTFTLWWAANDRPRVRSDDEGFWSRAKVIGCQNAIPKARQNTRLAELWAQPEHAEAILAWLVEGCLAWRIEGLGTCAAVESESAAYRESQDPTAEFWADCVEPAGNGQQGAFLARTALWAAWERWLDENGGDGAQWVKKRDLNAKVLERFTNAAVSAIRGTRGFKGIRLRPRDPNVLRPK
jgi:putative DNA primase/helicase